jgi:hypothetical protein
MDNEITLTVKPDEEIIESLIICIKPNGNKSVNIKRGKRSDRALIAACSLFFCVNVGREQSNKGVKGGGK